MRSPLPFQSIQKKRLTVAIQIGLLMGISHAAYAEDVPKLNGDNEATPSTTLDAVTVYADSYRSTGTKTALNPNDAPMSYTRIDQELLQKRQADSVKLTASMPPYVMSQG